MSFKDLFSDNEGVISIYKNLIDIKNYQDILNFDDNKFKIKINNYTVTFIGKEISVKMLKAEELILVGDINTVEYR